MATKIARLDSAGIATLDATRAALGALRPADQLRLKKLAQARATRCRGVEWQDLLHEAFARILRGSRRWPSNVAFIAFVAETMRSIASEWQEKNRGADACEAEAQHIASDAPDPERNIIALDSLECILDAFEGDAAVLALIAGLETGETAQETIRRCALTHDQYEAARKRFRRGLSKIIASQGSMS